VIDNESLLWLATDGSNKPEFLMRPACAGLVPISGNQFKSVFISVELLAAAY
jgi:hypothetical protein